MKKPMHDDLWSPSILPAHWMTTTPVRVSAKTWMDTSPPHRPFYLLDEHGEPLEYCNEIGGKSTC